MHRRHFAAALALTALAAVPAVGQVQLPRASPTATVTQRLGVTDLAVEYHRPAVKGRKIWGALVPYGEPWRVGANERTKFTVSSDVTINGQPLPAGSYGLAMIPTESTWTVVFSKVVDSWGTFQYDPKEDALRVTVTPEVAPDQEWMSFSFEALTPNSARVDLRWEKLRVPFTVEVDLDKTVTAEVKKAVTWQTLMQAAMFALDRGTDLAQGLSWARASIALDENFFNLRTLARLLAKSNDTAGAITAGDQALAVAKAKGNPSVGTAVADFEKELAGWKAKK